MCYITVERCAIREETTLADVIVEAFETSEAKPNDWIFFTDLTFRFVLHTFSIREAMKRWDPYDTLRLLSEPVEELRTRDGVRFP